MYELKYGGTVYPYRIIRSDRRTLALEIREGQILVRAPKKITAGAIREFVDSHGSWIEKTMDRQKEKTLPEPMDEGQEKQLRQQAGEVIRARAAYYAEKMGVKYNRIFIKEQKTRWGSCSVRGNLNFNWKLILTGDEQLDYVVVHELAHLKQMNHSPRFWREVEKILPDYRERRRRLKDYRL